MSSYAEDMTTGIYLATLTVYNITDNTSQAFSLAVGGHTSPPPYENDMVYSYNALANKDYRFNLKLTGTLPVSNNYLEGNTIVKYDEYGSFTDAPGIRIKRIINQASPADNQKITRYYYNKRDLINTTDIVTVLPVVYLQQGEQMDCDLNNYTILNTTTLSSSSLTGLYIDDSQKRIYPYITKSYGGDNFENGGEELSFKVTSDGYNLTPYIGNEYFSPSRTNLSWENGTLYQRKIFKKDSNGNFKDLQQTIYKYKVNNSRSESIQNYAAQLKYQICISHQTYDITNVNLGRYTIFSKWYALDSVITKDYFNNDIVTSIKNYKYDSGLAGLPSEIITTMSNSDKVTYTKTYYPDDVQYITSLGYDSLTSDEKSAINSLNLDNLHRVATPVQIETKIKNSQDSILSNSVVRTNFYEQTGTGLILPKEVQTLKGEYNSSTNKLDDRLVYQDYYDHGNIKEVLKKDGTHIVYIWGYNEQYPIAKLENVTYNQIGSQVLNLQNKSDADNDRTFGNSGNEGALRTALTNLRNSVPVNALVTTYTYDPLIGVTSITDPSGYTSYYVYDEFNRLRYIKNDDGKVLEQYRYNYALEALSVGSVSAPASVQEGNNITIIATINGGSGNFTYNWSVPGVGNLPNSNQITFQALSSHVPSVTASCVVTDNQTLESISFTKQVNVSSGYPALSVSNISQVPGTTSTFVGNTITYSVVASGGSGNYNYTWTKTNSQNTVTLSNGSSSSVTNDVQSSDCSSFTIKCIVTDNTTGETQTKSILMNVVAGCIGGGIK